MTFRELNHRANQLGRFLRRLRFDAEPLVGLCVEPSVEFVEGVLAILKAGGAYVPLDPAHIQERAAFVLDDARVSVLLTQEEIADRIAANHPTTVCLDVARNAIAREHQANLRPTNTNGLAHVYYTSGSTGRPKGVLGTHQAEVNRLRWMWRQFPYGTGETACLKTSLDFIDASSEMFWALLKGVPLVIVPRDNVRDVRSLVSSLAEHKVTRLVAVPSLLQAILDVYPDLPRRLSNLRLCMSCGEPLPRHLVHQFQRTLPDCRLVNLYGSTEVTADATCYEIRGEFDGSVPIGKPIDNVSVHILDERMRPVENGMRGELYIGGAGLARGYLNQPGLTAERFVANPFSDQPGEQLYRTGDTGRLLADGNIEFLGRIDHQIKIRGFRVEPGEIEDAIVQFAGVNEAVVVALEHSSRPKHLVAYIAPSACEHVGARKLTDFLQQRLPDYMIPATFVWLDGLPRNTNGKVDRSALPPPDSEGCAEEHQIVLPRTHTEHVLADIWRRHLRLARVGINQNFFALGGDSLSALAMVLEVEQVLESPVPGEFFQQSTIATLARLVQSKSTGHGHERSISSNQNPAGRLTPYVRPRYPKWKTRVESLAFRLPYFQGVRWLSWACASRFVSTVFYRRETRLLRRFLSEFDEGDRPATATTLHRALVTSILERHLEIATGDACVREAYLDGLRSSGLSFWEPFASIATAGPQSETLFRQHFKFEGIETLHGIARQKRGVILLTYHGPLFQFAIPAVHHLGFHPVNVLAMNNILRTRENHDGSRQLRGEELAAAVSELMQAAHTTLRRGGLVLMEGEGRKGQIRCHRSIVRRVYTMRAGFAELALATGASVVPTTMALMNDGRIQLSLHQPIGHGDDTECHAERVLSMVTQYAEFLETAWRAAPESLALYRHAWHLTLPEVPRRE